MLERLIKIFKDYKADEDLMITEETAFKDLGLDSLDTVELIMNVEEEFGVTVPTDDPVKTVGDLLKIIENNA